MSQSNTNIQKNKNGCNEPNAKIIRLKHCKKYSKRMNDGTSKKKLAKRIKNAKKRRKIDYKWLV